MTTSFDLDEACALLERTPATLDVLLAGLPDAWIRETEGPDTWSAFDVVGHLAHGERTDWMVRARMILDAGETQPFAPFDRVAMFANADRETLGDRLEAFATLRRRNLDALRELRLTPADLERKGRHPDFGPVTLRQLLATWVAHDLNHVGQIARVLAARHRETVGPWRVYLPVLQDRPPPRDA